jgi:deazaflavin-dependent oxidoreductase (nitroreductase family)
MPERSRPAQLPALVRLVIRAHTTLFRLTRGRLGARVVGAPVLLLTTIGRKTGKPRTTALIYLRDHGAFVIAASNGGVASHPTWYLNLKSYPEALVELPGQKLRVRAEQAGPDERARLWPLLTQLYSGYIQYQQKTTREIPVMLLRPLGQSGTTG